MDETENKSITSDIANSFVNVFKMDQFKTIIRKFVSTNFNAGIEELENQLNFNVSFGTVKRQIEMDEQYTFDLIKGMTDDIEKKLRSQIQQSLINNEDPKQLKKRVADIFKGDNPTRFRFEDRIKMIAQTEGSRANNSAKLAAAREYGGLLKYIRTRGGKLPCPICAKAGRKYTKEDAISVDKEFIVSHAGKTYRNMDGIFHPNCYCSVIITKPKEKKE